jgi:LemA protein
MLVLTTLGIVILLAAITVVVSYNGLTDRRQQIRLAWTGMDQELKRRYVVLSRLFAAAGGLDQKPAAIEAMMAAKNQAAVAFNPTQLAAAETSLTQSVRSLPATGNPAVDGVRRELSLSENAIGQAISRYNDRVHIFNCLLHSFPNSVVAVVLRLKPETEFHAGEVTV